MSSSIQYCVAMSHAETKARLPALLSHRGSARMPFRTGGSPQMVDCSRMPTHESMKNTGGAQGLLGGRQLALPRAWRNPLCAKAKRPAVVLPGRFPGPASQAAGAPKATRKVWSATC